MTRANYYNKKIKTTWCQASAADKAAMKLANRHRYKRYKKKNSGGGYKKYKISKGGR